MKQLTLSCLVILLLIGCTKETIKDSDPVLPEIPKLELKQYFAPYDISGAQPRSNCYWTEVPGGSVDALAEAVANTCEAGIVYLKAGTHTLNNPLVISKSVKIIGESGAILKLESSVIPTTEEGLDPLNPEIHVLNAPGTLIQDVEIQTIDGDGGTAILLENSPYSAVMRCGIINYQNGIITEKSDFTTLMFNNIVVSGAWQDGTVANANGIINMNGKSAYISDNDVSNSVFGIFVSDEWGTLERNTTHGNLIGTILCNVIPSIVLPSGEITGALKPAANWKVRNNNSYNNLSHGYLVIDGANNNLLENNDASSNALYDIEITSDTYRFGFFVPKAYDNTVNAGDFSHVTIKNCGPNNKVSGGVLIDNEADPCF